MAVYKKFFRDRIVLLLLSINAFCALLGTILILLRLSNGQGSYIIQYRANLGISAYTAGKAGDMLIFILFLFVVLIINTLLSVKIYGRHRSYALTILGLGDLLSLLAVIVSNALLILR
ncbi:hypothetical protein KDA11_06070 [Candidatus Saccharibacteria bacterium]|nr:hypothetical protein [Candidatus Saccharibacteria bacterium]